MFHKKHIRFLLPLMLCTLITDSYTMMQFKTAPSLKQWTQYKHAKAIIACTVVAGIITTIWYRRDKKITSHACPPLNHPQPAVVAPTMQPLLFSTPSQKKLSLQKPLIIIPDTPILDASTHDAHNSQPTPLSPDDEQEPPEIVFHIDSPVNDMKIVITPPSADLKTTNATMNGCAHTSTAGNTIFEDHQVLYT